MLAFIMSVVAVASRDSIIGVVDAMIFLLNLIIRVISVVIVIVIAGHFERALSIFGCIGLTPRHPRSMKEAERLKISSNSSQNTPLKSFQDTTVMVLRKPVKMNCNYSRANDLWMARF